MPILLSENDELQLVEIPDWVCDMPLVELTLGADAYFQHVLKLPVGLCSMPTLELCISLRSYLPTFCPERAKRAIEDELMPLLAASPQLAVRIHYSSEDDFMITWLPRGGWHCGIRGLVKFTGQSAADILFDVCKRLTPGEMDENEFAGNDDYHGHGDDGPYSLSLYGG